MCFKYLFDSCKKLLLAEYFETNKISSNNFREVLNCDKSTGLEYFPNDNSKKRDIKMEITTNKISHMRLSFKTPFKIEFFTIANW